jgi:Tfp pilus assembly ATPase PilU
MLVRDIRAVIQMKKVALVTIQFSDLLADRPIQAVQRVLNMLPTEIKNKILCELQKLK